MLYEVTVELVGPPLDESDASEVVDALADHRPAVVLGSAHSAVICSVDSASLVAAVTVVITAAIDATGREPLTVEAMPQAEADARLADSQTAADVLALSRLLRLSTQEITDLVAQGRLLYPPPA